MNALADWHQYLMGAQHSFKIWTDHRNLTYFRQPQKLNRRQARWHTELQSYNFTMIHRPGRSMHKTDILSRLEEHAAGPDDNKDVTILAKHFFRPITVETLPTPIIDRIRQVHHNQDNAAVKGLVTDPDNWTDRDQVIAFQ